jgi:quercetin dioxygenase-like cupin family protein
MHAAKEAEGDVLRLENRHTGEILHVRRVQDASGQTVLEVDGSLPARASGPPPHVHFNVHEEGIVKAGFLGARVGKETMVIPAGGSAAFPAGVVHSWWNAGDVVLELSGRVTPAGDLDSYLQGIFAVLNAGPRGRPSLFYLAHVVWRHRHTQSLAAPPRAVQRVVFPLILLVGRILGKYRGTSWPGSPESCTGAPVTRTLRA